MIKKISILYLFIFVCANMIAQPSDKSKQLLEQSSTKNNGYKTIKADFKFSTSNLQNDKTINETGKIEIKGDKYHLSLSNTDIIFDGKAVYTYLKEANEVNITKPEPSKKEKGDFFFSNPHDVFKIYSKDFKSKLIQETTLGSTPCYEIDLYPIDLKTKYSRIRMHIVKANLQILDLKIFQKDGTLYLLEFSTFITNSDINETEFTFDSKKYPKAEVNDMRF